VASTCKRRSRAFLEIICDVNFSGASAYRLAHADAKLFGSSNIFRASTAPRSTSRRVVANRRAPTLRSLQALPRSLLLSQLEEFLARYQHIDATGIPGPVPAVAHHDHFLFYVAVRLDGQAADGNAGCHLRRFPRQRQAADPDGERLTARDTGGLPAAEGLPRAVFAGRVWHYPSHRQV
jgi:hypothetical protein